MTAYRVLATPDANPNVVTGTAALGDAIPAFTDIPAAVLPYIRDKTWRYIAPDNDGSPVLVGITANQLSGAAYVSPTNVDLRTGSPRINTQSNTANVLVGNNYTDPPCSRGSVAGVGGFFVCFRFAIVVLGADAVVAIGLNNTVIGGGANPSASANRIVLGADTADANLSWISVDNAVAATKSAAVISKANVLIGDPNTNGPCVFEVRMWAIPNDNKVTCQLINRSTGLVVDQRDITATLPLNTTNLRPTCVASSKTNGAPATSFDFIHWFAYY